MSIREHSVAIIQQPIALLALLDCVENAAAQPTCLEVIRMLFNLGSSEFGGLDGVTDLS
jgi:hypothetical protein|eukprot:COSAG02_NODE_423_length_22576_cov_62.034791_1_plen_59_part_00